MAGSSDHQLPELSRAAPGFPRGRLGVLVAIVAVLVLLPSASAAQFSAHPVQIELNAVDRVETETITVQNRSGEPLDLRVYVSDYDRAVEGGHSYLSFGEHPNSCAGRLQVFPDQLSLQPDESSQVRVRLEPDSATCWGIVFIERRELTPSGITIAQRIGAKVFGLGVGGPPAGKVVAMTVDTADEPSALVTFENEGDRIVEITGEIEVRDLEGEIHQVLELDPGRVLPGRSRRFRVSLGGLSLEPGQYLLVAILDFGAEYLVGGQAMYEVAP